MAGLAQYNERLFKDSNVINVKDSFNTVLTPQEEEQFQEDVKNRKLGLKSLADLNKYDLRGYWKKLKYSTDSNYGKTHLSDEFKKPIKSI